MKGSAPLWVGHADREQAIDTLKEAFVRGRLTKEELDERAGRALVARNHVDLAALTDDIPPSLVGVRPGHPPVPARRRPLVRAAAASGICLIIMAAAMRLGQIVDPGATPTPYDSFGAPLFLIAMFSAFAAVGIFAFGVAAAVEQRRSRSEPPPPSGTGPENGYGCSRPVG
jgi:hypothetical protein